MSHGLVRTLLVVAAVVYLFAFAGDGLHAPLTGDDLMNTYQYWAHPLSQVIKEGLLFFPAEIARPLGALFYSPLFALFGLNPVPYRIVCLALLLANLGLLYAFCFRLSRSREVGVVACLIGAYQAANVLTAAGLVVLIITSGFAIRELTPDCGSRSRCWPFTWPRSTQRRWRLLYLY